MTQETHLFHDSIKNNLRIAKRDASDAEIEAACRKASVHDFIMSLPQGYDKGGSFAFQDMFAQKALYGDMAEFVRELKKEGISEIYYIGNVEKKVGLVPVYARAPWMISGAVILYGIKQGKRKGGRYHVKESI